MQKETVKEIVTAATSLDARVSSSPHVFGWLREGTPAARRSLLAASMGWMLDGFDIMLYALVVSALLRDLSISTGTAGLLGSLTLVASGIGGILFGLIADRFGRRPALIGSILVYSIFTAACGLARSTWQLGVFRFLLGLGMGGEWTSGAAMVSEAWPDRHRGKAARGGLGLGTSVTTLLVVTMQIGTFFGYVSFGYVSDAVGRRRAFVTYILVAAVLTLLYGFTPNPWILLVLGPVVAFFGTGFFSGFGAVTAEIYPTSVRAIAQGFTFNVGRLGSAIAPFLVGSMAQTQGFGVAFSMLAGALLIGAATWIGLPETRGRSV